ncbi:MAG: hypothetical protein ACPG4T_12625, partial [Nannocystaceae bacterium]
MSGLLLVACSAAPEPGARPSPALAEVTVEAEDVLYSGCEAVLRGPVCEFRPAETTLRLWLPVHPDNALDLYLDDVHVDAEFSTIDLGQSVVITLQQGHSGVSSLSILAREPGNVVWSLALSEHSASRPKEVVEADGLAKRGQVEDALALLARAREVVPKRERAYLDRAQGGLEYGRNRYRKALGHYERAYLVAVRHGLLREASEIALTAVFTCVLVHDLAAGEQWLRQHEALLEEYPPGRLVHSYYSGLVATGQGNLRQALRDYVAHANHARKLGQVRDLFAARSQEGVLRGHLGDFEGASKAYRIA